MTDQRAICLDDQAISLVSALGGRWQGDTALCFCPAHDGVVPQLRVRIGVRALLFDCSAGCYESDIVAAIGRLQKEGAASGAVSDRNARPAHPLTTSAHQLWANGQPIKGTLAERYLSALVIQSSAAELRYAPRCSARAGQSVSYHPALLAAVRDQEGLVAVERSYLRADGLGLADIPNPKRMLGFPVGGLGRWGVAPAKILRLAQDVEEALSAMIVGSQGIPVWPVFGFARYANIDVPPGIERIIIYARTDEASVQAMTSAAHHLSGEDRIVEVLYPPSGDSWNAYLRLIRS